MKSFASAIVVLAIVAFILHQLGIFTVTKTTVYYPVSYTITRKTLEFYSLNRTADEVHQVSVKGSGETKWFRSSQPWLHLGHCQPDTIRLTQIPDSSYLIVLEIDPQFEPDIRDWSSTRIGIDVGTFINGHLVGVWKMAAEMRYRVGISASTDLEKAQAMLAEIQAGITPY